MRLCVNVRVVGRAFKDGCVRLDGCVYVCIFECANGCTCVYTDVKLFAYVLTLHVFVCILSTRHMCLNMKVFTHDTKQ